jgi:hypothetical protein
VDVQEKRKATRFELKLPLELLREGSAPVHRAGETCNLSTAGVLFTSPTELPIGQPIEYLITLPGGKDESVKVRLRCMGKVVRTVRPNISTVNPVSVAATLERYEFVRG